MGDFLMKSWLKGLSLVRQEVNRKGQSILWHTNNAYNMPEIKLKWNWKITISSKREILFQQSIMFIATWYEESKGTISHLDIYVNKRICIFSLCKISGKVKEINTHTMDDKLSLPSAGKLETVLHITLHHNCLIISWHLFPKHLELASFMQDTKCFNLLWKSSCS